MTKAFVYTILTPFVKQKDLDQDSLVLDNSTNERPDWYEYWPIRKFLKSAQLEEDAYYAFLSPRFKDKTNLRVAAALEFVSKQDGHPDVVLFSPSLHLTAYYWNVFLYGDYCHHGLVSLASEFFARIGEPTNLDELVTHSQNEVYSNYFFARPRFWRSWLAILEQLISIAETPNDLMGKRLRAPTSYRGRADTQMKVFLMERVPTWLIARNANIVVKAHDPFAARSRVYKLPGAIVCDALKLAYVSNGATSRYKDLFLMVSNLSKPIGWLFRLGYFLGFPGVRLHLDRLSKYWTRAGRL